MKLTEPLKHLGLTGDYTENHMAIDLGFSKDHGGTNPNILAMADGTVAHIYKTDTGGNIIVVRYEDNNTWYYSVYKHCKKILKVEGEEVERGEPVAVMGKTGIATGNHLHLELYKCKKGTSYSTSSNFKHSYSVVPYEYFYYNKDVHLKKETKGKFKPLEDGILEVGDFVKIIGYGNSQASGNGKRAAGIGYKRVIKDILPGCKYPYKVGNKLATTGYYQEDALELIKGA